MSLDLMETVHLIAIYIVVVLLGLCSLTLLCINIHIYITSRKECKKKEGSEGKIFCLVAALCGIVCFQISLLLTIAAMVQFVLVDGHKLHPESNSFHKFYFSAFEEMEYLIPIFDQFGHLCMLAVFVKRYQICFRNSVFAHSSAKSVRFLYTCLCVLLVLSIGIFIEIIRDDQDVLTIIVSEIIWEILTELTCIGVFYLFISKLYHLVQFSLSIAIPKNEPTLKHSSSSRASAFRNFSDTVKSTRSKSGSKSGSGSKHKSNEKQSQKHAQTASGDHDGVYDTTQTRGRTLSATAVEPSYTMHSAVPQLRPQASSQKPLTHPAAAPQQESQRRLSDSAGLIDIVELMNKFTLLVVIAVGTSMLSIIGHVFIEVHHLKNLKDHVIDMASVWVYLLPAVDIVVASFTLYLQFGFSSPMYSKLCSKCDSCFMKFCLDLNYWHLRREDEKANGGRNVEQEMNESDKKTKQVVELQTDTRGCTATSSTNTTGVSSGDADKGGDDTVIVTVDDIDSAGSSGLDKDTDVEI